MNTPSATLSLSLLLSFFLLFHSSHSHDVTQVLSSFPEFSTFNNYLTETNLASQINAQQTVTVLVVDNANLASLSSNSIDLIHNILAVHVILDYYDAAKLQTLSSTSALATTIFQSTGIAKGQQGFLNVSRTATGPVSFTSAMPGSPPGSTFVKPVFSAPYTFSVLQISNAIIPQGIDGTKTSSPPSVSPPGVTSPPPTSAPILSSPPLPSPPILSSPPLPSAVPSTVPPTPSAAASVPPTPGAAASVPPTPGAAASVPPAPGAAASVPPTPSAAATVPSTAPPTSSMVPPLPPSPGSPKPSTAPFPSTIPPMMSKAPLPSSVPPMSIAATPSASTPTASAPGAMGPAAAAAAPTILDAPGETPPAVAAPKAKSAGKSLHVGLAVVFTMVVSTLYQSSSTV